MLLAYGLSKLLLPPSDPALSSPITGASTRPAEGRFIAPVLHVIGLNAQLISPYWLPTSFNSIPLDILTRVTALGILAAPLLALLRKDPTVKVWGIGLALGMIGIPALVQLRELITRGSFFPSPVSRYQIIMVPLAIGLGAVLIRDQPAGRRAAMLLTAATALTLSASFGGILI